MNKADQIALIERMANTEVSDELDYHLNGIERDESELEEGEEPYDMLSAFNDVLDKTDGNESSYSRGYVRNVREIAIALGWYREITDEELSRTISSGGKAYAFKIAGKKYTWHGRE